MNIIKFNNVGPTVTEAAEWLQVSRETIYSWVRTGRVSYVYEELFDPHRFKATKCLNTEDLDRVRHERIVEAGQELDRRQAIPRLG
jgi:predicted site-specific integrase-resolvase